MTATQLPWQRAAQEAWEAHQDQEAERAERLSAPVRDNLLAHLDSLEVPLHLEPGVPSIYADPGGTWYAQLAGTGLVAVADRSGWWLELDGRRVGDLDTMADLGRALELEATAGEEPAEEEPELSAGELLLQVLRAIVADVVTEQLEQQP